MVTSTDAPCVTLIIKWRRISSIIWVIVSEQGFAGLDFTEPAGKMGSRPALWAQPSRNARGGLVARQCWRPVDAQHPGPGEYPELRLPGMLWLITEVSFVVDLERGKVAEITMMPPEAFALQPPVSLWDKQVMQAMQEAAQ
jgi:hypothetical protein